MLHVGFELPLLVMSVHTNVDGLGLRWLEIQNRFLEETTTNFVHVVCLVNTDLDPPDALVVARHSSNADGGVQHVSGLRALSEYARKHRKSYRAFLVLDSDCFPISNWETGLADKMAKYSRSIACVIRPENLDTFAHPAAVFTSNPDKLNFSSLESTNMLGEKVIDSACDVSSFYPMLRTNHVNLHPIAYGVYYDMFYHHGAGSRTPRFRCDPYYGIEPKSHNGQFFEDPRAFIEKLR